MRTEPDYFNGMPRRMGVALAAMFERDGYEKHPHKLGIIGEAQNAHESLSLNASEDDYCRLADSASRECYARVATYKTSDAGLAAIGMICRAHGVPLPEGETDAEKIARAVDRAWWLRQIRTMHGRKLEHFAIRVGLTSFKTGPYISDESALRQARRNRQNEKLLESITLENENGQRYAVSQLAALGPANKTIRRGELMTRIRGFEEIAQELGHVGEFVTVTCPSKYHSVRSKSGESNPKYIAFGSPTPRHAQAYLGVVWSRIRAKLDREGITIYGFRIAEPHHDGCPHWHMLLFVAPEHADRFREIVNHYALAEDFGEWDKPERRCKFVRISAEDGMSAAGYIAKYIAKNIDGHAVGEHLTIDKDVVRESVLDGYMLEHDLLGDYVLVPSQRVCFWSQKWRIRQFQQIGGAPVGVWRELRRIKESEIADAEESVKDAWTAAQREGDRLASWADYLRAQGGAAVGRNGAVQLAKRVEEIKGKYATRIAERPCGVYCVRTLSRIYESVRYRWTRVDGEGVGVAVAVPWTGVNNCTPAASEARKKAIKEAVFEKYGPPKNQKICSAEWKFVVAWDTERRYDENGKLAPAPPQKKRAERPFDAAEHLENLRRKHRG